MEGTMFRRQQYLQSVGARLLGDPEPRRSDTVEFIDAVAVLVVLEGVLLQPDLVPPAARKFHRLAHERARAALFRIALAGTDRATSRRHVREVTALFGERSTGLIASVASSLPGVQRGDLGAELASLAEAVSSGRPEARLGDALSRCELALSGRGRRRRPSAAGPAAA
jgi:hypothetical protein